MKKSPANTGFERDIVECRRHFTYRPGVAKYAKRAMNKRNRKRWRMECNEAVAIGIEKENPLSISVEFTTGVWEASESFAA